MKSDSEVDFLILVHILLIYISTFTSTLAPFVQLLSGSRRAGAIFFLRCDVCGDCELDEMGDNGPVFSGLSNGGDFETSGGLKEQLLLKNFLIKIVPSGWNMRFIFIVALIRWFIF